MILQLSYRLEEKSRGECAAPLNECKPHPSWASPGPRFLSVFISCNTLTTSLACICSIYLRNDSDFSSSDHSTAPPQVHFSIRSIYHLARCFQDCFLHLTGRRDRGPRPRDSNTSKVYISNQGPSRPKLVSFTYHFPLVFSSLLLFQPHSYTWLIKQLPPLIRHSPMSSPWNHGLCTGWEWRLSP